MIFLPLTLAARSAGLVAAAALTALLVIDIEPARLLPLARDLPNVLPWEDWGSTLGMPAAWSAWFPWAALSALMLAAHSLLALRPALLPATVLGLLLLHGVRAAGDLGGVFGDAGERTLLLGCLAGWTSFVAFRWGFPCVLAALLAALAGLFLFAPAPEPQRIGLQLLPALLTPWLARRSLPLPLPRLR